MNQNNENNQIVIVTPIYTEAITDIEKRRLEISLKNNSNFKHIFVYPRSLPTDKYKIFFSESHFLALDDIHFLSKNSYSELLLNPDFYSNFKNYKYVLILQLDAILLRNVSTLANFNFDYVGSAWKETPLAFNLGARIIMTSSHLPFVNQQRIEVGNGGLSLRNVQSMLELTRRIYNLRKKSRLLFGQQSLNEDFVISYFAKKFGLIIPTASVANKIFLESYADYYSESSKIYGFHALNRYNPELEAKILGYKM